MSMSANPLHGPRKRGAGLFRWPAQVGGKALSHGPLARCVACPEDAAPERRATWVRYGERSLCLADALAEAEA